MSALSLLPAELPVGEGHVLLALAAPSGYATQQPCTSRFLVEATPAWTKPITAFTASAGTSYAPTVQSLCVNTHVQITVTGYRNGQWEVLGDLDQPMQWWAPTGVCYGGLAQISVPAAAAGTYSKFRTSTRAFTVRVLSSRKGSMNVTVPGNTSPG